MGGCELVANPDHRNAACAVKVHDVRAAATVNQVGPLWLSGSMDSSFCPVPGSPGGARDPEVVGKACFGVGGMEVHAAQARWFCRDRPGGLSCPPWLSFVRTGTEACPYCQLVHRRPVRNLPLILSSRRRRRIEGQSPQCGLFQQVRSTVSLPPQKKLDKGEGVFEYTYTDSVRLYPPYSALGKKPVDIVRRAITEICASRPENEETT